MALRPSPVPHRPFALLVLELAWIGLALTVIVLVVLGITAAPVS